MKNKIIIISLIAVIIDQIIKILATTYLTNISIIPGFLSLVYAKNEGVAFSMLWGNKWFIIIISILLLGVLIYILNKEYLSKNENNTLKNIMFGLLFGGILGNLIDRIIRGYVVDYISLNIFGYSFPIFNLADVFITIGVILMIVYTIIDDKKTGNPFTKEKKVYNKEAKDVMIWKLKSMLV